jgi:N-acylneuraminate cytidylyltransferase
MKTIAIIPARGKSKGIPRKNIKMLCGKPLIVWTIEQALNSKVDEVYVSTEDKEIAEISKKAGAKVIERPLELAQDDSSTESVLLHASKVLKDDYEIMVLLQCTSPLRFPSQINEAIDLFLKEKADSLVSVYKNDKFLWKDGKSINYDFKNRPRRQEKDWEFVENGSIYVFKKEVLLTDENRLGGKIIQYEMPKWMSLEIDEEDDFKLAEFLMRTKYPKQKPKNIKLVIFDVDGVFTDGSVYLDEEGGEMLKFSRIDGKGIELLKKKCQVVAISSENSRIIIERMMKLGVTCYIGIKNKSEIYNRLKKKYNLKDEEICVCGDDVQDICILEKAGFSCCPANAQEEVKEICSFISDKKGGDGFVRDVCDLLI